MTPADAPAPEAAADPAEAGALRLLDAFHAEVLSLPGEVQGAAVLSALAGMISGVLTAIEGDEARRWAWQTLWHQIMRAGVKHGVVEFGCDDPDCTACGGKEAGEARPTVQ